MYFKLFLVIAALGFAKSEEVEGSGAVEFKELTCDFEDGDCGMIGKGDSNHRLSIETNEDGGKFLAFTVPEDEPKNYQLYTRLPLGKLPAGEAYCLTFSYSLSGTGAKDIVVEEAPTKEVKRYSGETDSQEVELNLQGNDQLVRFKLHFDSKSVGVISIDDVKLAAGEC